jgi:hypothetical protein
MNTIFDLYQTVSNISINHETISKRNISSHDIVLAKIQYRRKFKLKNK